MVGFFTGRFGRWSVPFCAAPNCIVVYFIEFSLQSLQELDEFAAALLDCPLPLLFAHT